MLKVQSYKMDESDPRFQQYEQQVTIDMDAIAAKKQLEREKEMEMGNNYRHK